MGVDLAGVIASRADGTTRLRAATVTDDYRVNVSGGLLRAQWADNITVAPGDKALVALSSEPGEQASAIVLCRLTDTPRASYGTVVDASSSSSTVGVRAGGVVVRAERLNNLLPSVGDTVALLWQGSTPLLLGRRAVTKPLEAESSTGPSINKPAGSLGPVSVSAVTSATWDNSTGRFNSYFSRIVGQGSWGDVGPLWGAWYYDHAGEALKGRTKSLTIYIPARRAGMGWDSADMPVSLSITEYRNPTGKPWPTGTAHTLTLPAGWSGGTMSLPASWIPLLADGNGIVMHGDMYGGVDGKPLTGDSGKLTAT